MRVGRLLALPLFLCVLLAAVASAQIELRVALDRDALSLDEQATLQVIVSGPEQNLPAPVVPKFSEFELYSQGRSTNISITNGVLEASVTYLYLVLPQKAGTFTINGITLQTASGTVVAQPVTFTVSGGSAPSGQQNQQQKPGGGSSAPPATGEARSRDYFLEASVDTKTPYVGQQVTLTLKFFTAVQYFGSPQLEEPQTTGFWTEILGNESPYMIDRGGRRYRVIERKYALFPTKTGELTIGRASLSVTIAGQSRSRDPFDVFGSVFGRGQDVVLRSTPIELDVRPLPDNNKPADFTGAIGNFTLEVKPSKTVVDANQPITLTIKIQGTGNIKSIAEPLIPESPDFRVYQASSSETIAKLNDKLGGTKTFEEVFIPRRPGEMEIPSIAFNFFNPRTGQYESISTKPIPVTAHRPEGFVADESAPFLPPTEVLGSASGEIRHIKADIGKTQPTGALLLTSPLYIGINALPVVALIAGLLWRRREAALARNQGLARSLGASKSARKRLSRARALADAGTSGDCYAELSLALTSFVADKLNVSPHGLTTEMIDTLLQQRGADEQIRSSLAALIRQADFARFAAQTSSSPELLSAVAKAEELMTRLEGLRFD